MRTSVDLPLPFGPVTPATLPACMGGSLVVGAPLRTLSPAASGGGHPARDAAARGPAPAPATLAAPADAQPADHPRPGRTAGAGAGRATGRGGGAPPGRVLAQRGAGR